jgi:hypothetical protein
MELQNRWLSISAVIAIALVLGLAGCTSSETTNAEPVLVDEFQAVLDVEVALKVLDMSYSFDDLTARETKSLKIFEPFDKADTEFTVIDFGQLLVDSGLSQEDRIVTIAINDYRYTDTVSNFMSKNAYLALLENNKPIPVTEGGPVRIVFDTSSEYYGFLDAWNWSLSSIERAGE